MTSISRSRAAEAAASRPYPGPLTLLIAEKFHDRAVEQLQCLHEDFFLLSAGSGLVHGVSPLMRLEALDRPVRMGGPIRTSHKAIGDDPRRLTIIMGGRGEVSRIALMIQPMPVVLASFEASSSSPFTVGIRTTVSARDRGFARRPLQIFNALGSVIDEISPGRMVQLGRGETAIVSTSLDDPLVGVTHEAADQRRPRQTLATRAAVKNPAVETTAEALRDYLCLAGSRGIYHGLLWFVDHETFLNRDARLVWLRDHGHMDKGLVDPGTLKARLAGALTNKEGVLDLETFVGQGPLGKLDYDAVANAVVKNLLIYGCWPGQDDLL